MYCLDPQYPFLWGPVWPIGKVFTRNPGVPCQATLDSLGFIMEVVLKQDTSEPQPSTGETQERHE